MPLLLQAHLYDAIQVQHDAYAIDYYLLAAVCFQESGFNPLAIGDNGRSYGLMQLNLDGAGAGHSPSQLLEIDYNLEVGAAYLRRCLDAYPIDLQRAVAAYNRGIAGAAPPFDPSTNPYTQNVLNLRDHFAGIGVFRDTRLWREP